MMLSKSCITTQKTDIREKTNSTKKLAIINFLNTTESKDETHSQLVFKG